MQLYGRSSYPYIASIAWPLQAYVRALRLDRLGALDVVQTWRESGIRGASRFELLVDALTLPEAELTERVDLGRYQPAASTEPHAFTAGALAIDVEIGSRLGNTDLLSGALVRLDRLVSRGVALLLPTGASVHRLRGMALVGLGDVDRGVAVLEAAAADLARSGAEVERLWCQVERCLALVPAGAPDAGELARVLDAASLLGLLHRLLEHLPPGIAIGTRLRRTVVVWDMVESTRHLIAMGDMAFVSLVHDLNQLIARRLAEHGGVAFKYTGDGVYAWFLDEADAVRCAVAVDADLRRRRLRSPGDPLRLRAGVAVGQPVNDAGDLFGLAVVVAARLCDAASDDAILCTAETTAEMAHLTRQRPLGPMVLKGLQDPVEVVEIPTA